MTIETSSGRIQLGYGGGSLTLSFDPARFQVLDAAADRGRVRPEHEAVLGAAGDRVRALPDREVSPELTKRRILDAIERPTGSPALRSIVRATDRVCIVVPDATRASGSARVASALLQVLSRDAGLPDTSILFLVGAGTHRAPTQDEILRIIGPEAASRVRVENHDAFDDTGHIDIGTTPRGTPVELNRRLRDADHVVLVGAIGFHYFAGFSGGRKGLLPACASDRSIQKNHLLGFDLETLAKAPGVETARLDGNPVSEDMEDAARLFGPAFLVNTVLDAESEIVAAYAGHWYDAHRKGCADYLASHSVPAAERRSVVIVSAGGAPRDLNMIQSHKALEHARVVLEDGGDLILVAACTDGLGRPDFLDWFVPGGARATARKLVHGYRINGQTAWGIRWKTERYRVRLISELDPEVVRRMGMIPHASLEDAIRASDPGPGYILPHGLGTLPVLRESSEIAAGA